MATISFSIQLDTEVKARLDEEARREDHSADQIVQKAIEDYLEAKAYFRREMEAAIAEADKGIFISWEKMRAWMESWDTGNELPPPEPDIFPDKK
jgi:predicted transcriptional regulator